MSKILVSISAATSCTHARIQVYPGSDTIFLGAADNNKMLLVYDDVLDGILTPFIKKTFKLKGKQDGYNGYKVGAEAAAAVLKAVKTKKWAKKDGYTMSASNTKEAANILISLVKDAVGK